MKKKDNSNWAFIGCGLIVLFWIVLGAWELIRYFQGKSTSSAFDAMNEQAKSVCKICFSQVTEFPWLLDYRFDTFSPYSPYLRGKVLVVEANTGEVIGSTMIDMPSEMAAESPEEVSTLVCAGEVDQQDVRTYTDGQPGYQLVRDVCVYDIPMDAVIFAARIFGTSPPLVKQRSGPHIGTDPAHYELIRILEGLPIGE